MPGKDDCELVAAQPGEDVLRAQAELQPVAKCLEQRIAGLVPEAVVDLP